MQKLKIKLADSRCMPEIGSVGSAGMDLRLYLGSNIRQDLIELKAGEVRMFSTGVYAEIPEGWVGIIVPRSSVGYKRSIRIANTVGVIDSDYRGEIKLPLFNYGSEAQILENFERLCQMVVVPFFPPQLVEVVDELSDTVRGEGGFGHSGTK